MPGADKNYILSEADRADFIRMRRKLDSIRGPGVTNSPDSIFINVPPAAGRVARGGGDSPITAVKFTAATSTVGVWDGKLMTGVPGTAGAFGDLDEGGDCTIVNEPEFATAGDAYAIPTGYITMLGVAAGTDPDHDDRPVVYVTVPLQDCE